MLPLSDRILLKLERVPMTARQLSKALAADDHDLHHILRALEAQGAVEELPVPKEGSLWRLAPGVRLTFRPASLELTGCRPPTVHAPAAHACRAVSARGRPCKLPEAREGLCFLHAPRSRPSPRDFVNDSSLR